MGVDHHGGQHFLLIDGRAQFGCGMDHHQPLDVRGARQLIDKRAGRPPAILIPHADGDVLDLQRGRRAEQHQLDQRREYQDNPPTRITQRRPQLFDDHREKTRADHATRRRVTRMVAAKNTTPKPSKTAILGRNNRQSSPARNTVSRQGIR